MTFKLMNHLHSIFISLAILLSTLTLNAQENVSIEDSPAKLESFFTFDVFSSLNTYSPRWRVGFIRDIDPKWKVGLNLGYGNKNISYTYFADKFEEDYKLWEIRPELYYVRKRSQKATTYASFELYYINHKDVFHNSSYIPVEGGCLSYDRADYLRQKYGFNVNIGTFSNLGRKLGLNFYTGIGLKIRNNSFSDIINPESTECLERDMYDDFEYRQKEGLRAGFNFSIGLKLFLK